MFTLHPMLERDTFSLGRFAVCRLLLMNDSNYPWFIMVPEVDNIQELFQLEEAEQIQILKESSRLSQILYQTFNADKLNIAALGNVCPQLHIHHVVRYKNDPAWPAPVWGKVAAKPYAENEKAAIIEKLRQPLQEGFTWF